MEPGSMWEALARIAQADGIRLEKVKLSEAKKGLYCSHTDRVTEMEFWLGRPVQAFLKGHGRLASTLKGMHWGLFRHPCEPPSPAKIHNRSQPQLSLCHGMLVFQLLKEEACCGIKEASSDQSLSVFLPT